MFRRLLIGAILLGLVSSAAIASLAGAKMSNAVGARKLIVVVKKNLAPAAEKKLAVLVLVSQTSSAPAGAVATASGPLTVRLANRGLYRVKAEIDSSCKGSCTGTYRISGAANHKLLVVPGCLLKRSGFVCSKVKIVKVY